MDAEESEKLPEAEVLGQMGFVILSRYIHDG